MSRATYVSQLFLTTRDSAVIFETMLQQVIQAEAGVPLGSDVTRRRAAGRICGTRMDGDPLVDRDACCLDGEPIRDVNEWRSLLLRNRISSVSGAFAAAWKEPDGTLCLARDGIGERSLFYAHLPNGLIFGSTLRTLLDTGRLRRRLNLPAVARYLSYAYIPGRETLIEGIHKLLPGESIRYRGGSL